MAEPGIDRTGRRRRRPVRDVYHHHRADEGLGYDRRSHEDYNDSGSTRLREQQYHLPISKHDDDRTTDDSLIQRDFDDEAFSYKHNHFQYHYHDTQTKAEPPNHHHDHHRYHRHRHHRPRLLERFDSSGHPSREPGYHPYGDAPRDTPLPSFPHHYQIHSKWTPTTTARNRRRHHPNHYPSKEEELRIRAEAAEEVASIIESTRSERTLLRSHSSTHSSHRQLRPSQRNPARDSIFRAKNSRPINATASATDWKRKLRCKPWEDRYRDILLQLEHRSSTRQPQLSPPRELSIEARKSRRDWDTTGRGISPTRACESSGSNYRRRDVARSHPSPPTMVRNSLETTESGRGGVGTTDRGIDPIQNEVSGIYDHREDRGDCNKWTRNKPLVPRVVRTTTTSVENRTSREFGREDDDHRTQHRQGPSITGNSSSNSREDRDEREEYRGEKSQTDDARNARDDPNESTPATANDDALEPPPPGGEHGEGPASSDLDRNQQWWKRKQLIGGSNRNVPNLSSATTATATEPAPSSRDAPRFGNENVSEPSESPESPAMLLSELEDNNTPPRIAATVPSQEEEEEDPIHYFQRTRIVHPQNPSLEFVETVEENEETTTTPPTENLLIDLLRKEKLTFARQRVEFFPHETQTPASDTNPNLALHELLRAWVLGASSGDNAKPREWSELWTMLLDAHPCALAVPGTGGYLPLHLACSSAFGHHDEEDDAGSFQRLEAIRVMLAIHPEAASHSTNQTGELPLHVLLRWIVVSTTAHHKSSRASNDDNKEDETIAMMLLIAHPEGANLRDHQGMSPCDVLNSAVETEESSGEKHSFHTGSLFHRLRGYLSFASQLSQTPELDDEALGQSQHPTQDFEDIASEGKLETRETMSTALDESSGPPMDHVQFADTMTDSEVLGDARLERTERDSSRHQTTRTIEDYANVTFGRSFDKPEQEDFEAREMWDTVRPRTKTKSLATPGAREKRRKPRKGKRGTSKRDALEDALAEELLRELLDSSEHHPEDNTLSSSEEESFLGDISVE